MNLRKYITLVFIMAFILLNAIYIQNQKETSIIVEFGKVVKQNTKPGLKYKIPFIQNVKFFDKRLQTIKFDMSENSEVIAYDQKTMQLDAYAMYKIINPKKFYESARDNTIFRARMISITESSIREVIGRVKFIEILGIKRNLLRSSIIELVNNDIKEFGVEVADVRITRINLPDKTRNAVYARMRSEREKEAKEIRAKGYEESQIIRSTSEKTQATIIAEAKKEADIIMGEGDSKAIEIYAKSYSKNEEFFEFFKSLESYKKCFSRTSKFILSTNNEFLKYFNKV